jgi:hypothetical protein
MEKDRRKLRLVLLRFCPQRFFQRYHVPSKRLMSALKQSIQMMFGANWAKPEGVSRHRQVFASFFSAIIKLMTKLA